MNSASYSSPHLFNSSPAAVQHGARRLLQESNVWTGLPLMECFSGFDEGICQSSLLFFLTLGFMSWSWISLWRFSVCETGGEEKCTVRAWEKMQKCTLSFCSFLISLCFLFPSLRVSTYQHVINITLQKE